MLRRLLPVFALSALLFAPAVASADTITLTDWTTGNFANNADGGGGPFKATTTGGLLDTDFVTLCIEYNEHFSYGGTYNFTLSGGAVHGGVAGGDPDPLSDATKWLFYHMATNSYAAIFTAAGVSIDANAGAVFQYAIWYFEQERTAAELGGVTSTGVTLANYATINQNWSTLFAAGDRVYAMNLTNPDGSPAQDQLAYTGDNTITETPVPEPASLLLLGSGLLAASRKFRKHSRKA